MHEYDTSLKLLLRSSGDDTMRELTGGMIVRRWLDVEMPAVQNTKVDLLGETATGDLVHIELQSTNDPSMPLRMAEYCLRIYRLFGRLPRQILLYVGEAPLRMETGLTGPLMSFRYEALDIRALDGERLLDSAHAGDNVIAILARLGDQREAVRRLLARIAGLGPKEREVALAQLLILSGLRRLERFVELEARKMPILNDIMDHKVLGREFRKGLEQGKQEGLEEGLEKGLEKGLQEGRQQGVQQGIHEGEFKVLRRLIEKRFGPLPLWAEEQLVGRSVSELEALSVRVLDAACLEDLLK